MALAASQFTNVRRDFGSVGRFRVTGTFTGPASYTATGEVLTNAICLAALGIRNIKRMEFSPATTASGTTARMVAFDHTPVAGTSQGKIHFYTGNADPPGDSTGDLSTFVSRFVAEGA